MLRLEHFKLLNPKAAKLSKGAGGAPDVTFEEVADLLATLDYDVSVYARLVYGMEWSLNMTMRNILVGQVLDYTNPVPLEDQEFAHIVAQMVIGTATTGYDLTPSQKAHLAGIKWWTRGNEAEHRNMSSILDNYDAELRHALYEWNEHQRKKVLINV